MSIMQPLRDEHRELWPHLEHLREVADEVGEVPAEELADRVGHLHRFLTEHLIPHAEAEDAWLYPAVAELLGGPAATDTMRRDHVEVRALTDALAGLVERLDRQGFDASLGRELRRVLYGLYALVTVHFAKEEEIYVPLLEERLSAEQARELLAAMHGTGGHTHD